MTEIINQTNTHKNTLTSTIFSFHYFSAFSNSNIQNTTASKSTQHSPSMNPSPSIRQKQQQTSKPQFTIKALKNQAYTLFTNRPCPHFVYQKYISTIKHIRTIASQTQINCACNTCLDKSDPRVCTTCKLCFCGWKANKHSFKHMQLSEHSTAIDPIRGNIYCYSCQEPIIFQTTPHSAKNQHSSRQKQQKMRYDEKQIEKVQRTSYRRPIPTENYQESGYPRKFKKIKYVQKKKKKKYIQKKYVLPPQPPKNQRQTEDLTRIINQREPAPPVPASNPTFDAPTAHPTNGAIINNPELIKSILYLKSIQSEQNFGPITATYLTRTFTHPLLDSNLIDEQQAELMEIVVAEGLQNGTLIPHDLVLYLQRSLHEPPTQYFILSCNHSTPTSINSTNDTKTKIIQNRSMLYGGPHQLLILLTLQLQLYDKFLETKNQLQLFFYKVQVFLNYFPSYAQLQLIRIKSIDYYFLFNTLFDAIKIEFWNDKSY